MSSSSSLVLRNVYLDESLEQALASEAKAAGVPKAHLFRQWLAAGIRAVRQGGRSRVPLPTTTTTSPLLLRTVGLTPWVDQLLRVQAFDEHVQQNDVLRQYLMVGFEMHGRKAKP